MTFHPLACGIHEARREIDPCPVCAMAAEELARELERTVSRVGKWSKRVSAEQAKRDWEATMVMSEKYTEAQRADALRRWEAGERPSDIAASIGCTPSVIYWWRRKVREAAAEPAKKAAKKADVAVRMVVDDAKAGAAPRMDVTHEDVHAFLTRLPSLPWALGDAIRLLASSALSGGLDEHLFATQARDRIDAYLRTRDGVRHG